MAAPMFDKSRSSHQLRSPAQNSTPALRVADVESASSQDDFPELYHDPSFWGMFATQFFGAFNDNLFKQLVLLLSIAAVGGAVAAGSPAILPVLLIGPLLLWNGLGGVAPLLMLIALTSGGASD